MTRVLITGAAGFIGSTLANHLVGQGYAVRGLDNLSTGKVSNLDTILDEMDFTQGDIRDPTLMKQLCDGVDVVFHQAAVASVAHSVADPVATHDINVTGTLNVLAAARAAGVARVVYAASSAIYGDSGRLPMQEHMAPAPMSPYAVQKLTGEHYMNLFAQIYGLETVCLRYFNVFGPHQAADSSYSGVLARFIVAMLRGTALHIYGDGRQTRDFTYVQDVVRANEMAAFAPWRSLTRRCYNIANGRSYSLLEVYETLSDLTGYHELPTFAIAREGDIRHSLADITMARRELGYQPEVTIQDGLRRTVEWYAESLGTAAGGDGARLNALSERGQNRYVESGLHAAAGD
ncbi:MAG: NAD-dependent epimerase/dehydratase family protein [Acidobacteriaceae bacterium]